MEESELQRIMQLYDIEELEWAINDELARRGGITITKLKRLALINTHDARLVFELLGLERNHISYTTFVKHYNVDARLTRNQQDEQQDDFYRKLDPKPTYPYLEKLQGYSSEQSRIILAVAHAPITF